MKNNMNMTQEDKKLLLKDLCARLPYGVKVYNEFYRWTACPKGVVGDRCYFNDNPRYDGDCTVEEVKPYLRPMSSMTDEERKEYESFIFTQHHEWDGHGTSTNYVETDDVERYVTWLNKNMFDYRGLIEKGLAIEAPENMYNLA